MSWKGFLDDAVKNKGYPPGLIQLVEKASEKGCDEGAILVLKVDRIEYPIGDELLRSLCGSGSADCVGITDGENTHIFRADSQLDGGFTEIDDLPAYGSGEDEDPGSDAEYFRDVLNEFAMSNRPPELSDINDAIAVAAYMYRQGMLRKHRWTPEPEEVGDVMDEMTFAEPGLLEDADRDVDEDFVSIVSRFIGIGYAPSPRMAEAYCDFLTSRLQRSARSKRLYDLALHQVGRGDVACYTDDALYPMCDVGRRVRVIARDPSFGRLVGYLSGTRNEILLDDPESPCENTIRLHDWGAQDKSDYREDLYDIKRSIFRCIAPGGSDGRAVALVPSSLLSSPADEAIRCWLLEEFSLERVIRLKSPLKSTTADGAMMVLGTDARRGDILYSIRFLTLDEAASGGDAMFDDPGMFERVPATRFTGRSFLVDDPGREFEGIQLGQCADIVKGVEVPSADFFRKGSQAGIPYVRVGGIKDGGVDTEGVPRVPSKYARVVGRPGDIILSIQGTIGKIGLVGERAFVPCAQTVLITPKDFVSSETLMKALQSRQAQIQIAAMTKGPSTKSISVSSLEKVKLVL